MSDEHMSQIFFFFLKMRLDFLWLTVLVFEPADLFNQHRADLFNDVLQEVHVGLVDEVHVFQRYEDLQCRLWSTFTVVSALGSCSLISLILV